MDNILKSIENSLQNKNWYSALVLSHILPDVCAKLEGNGKSSSVRYPEWFNTYLGKKYNVFYLEMIAIRLGAPFYMKVLAILRHKKPKMF